MSSESEHSYVKDGKYHKLCECVKCVRTFNEWCKKNRKEGCTTCKSKVKIIRVIECEQPITTVYKFGETREYEGKWEHHEALERPRHCLTCKKENKHCSCKDNKKDDKKDYHKKDDKKHYKKDDKKDDKKDCKKDHKKHRNEDSGFSDDY